MSISSLIKLFFFILLISFNLCDSNIEEIESTMVNFKKDNDTSIAEDIGQSLNKPHQIDSPISMKLKMNTKHNIEIKSQQVFFIMFIIGFVLFLFSYLEYVNKIDNYYITDIPMQEII